MSTSKNTNERHAVTLILGESYWEIRVPIGDFENTEAAVHAVDTSAAVFIEYDGRACLTVAGSNYDPLMLTDAHVTIREMTPAAIARLGPPLDMREPENRTIALNALVDASPAYIIEPEDFVPSRMTLSDFLTRYGTLYSPDCIGYEIDLVAQPERPIVSTADTGRA